MVTKKSRRVVLALVLAVGSVAPCLAKVSGEDFQAGSGVVRSFADDFTDAYQGTLLWIPGADGAGVHVDHAAGPRLRIFFYDREREYELPDDRATVEVVFRIDALEAVTLTTTTWSTRNKNAGATVSEVWVEELADMVLGAETIIYRIGSEGEIRRVPVPAEMPELIAEFRHRVAKAIMAAGDA